METVGAVIQASRRQTTMQCSNTSLSVNLGNKAFLAKYPSRSKVEVDFSPVNWGYTVANPDKAYSADCPTLLHYDSLYGEKSSCFWIKAQILALFGSSSSREKGVADGIGIFATSFAGQVRGFKLSEMMLFFARYKAGRYDNSYASFDARRIGNAFFKEFIPERNVELDKINRSKMQQEIEDRRFIPPDGYSSLSWYQELKRRAANGDRNAIKELGLD